MSGLREAVANAEVIVKGSNPAYESKYVSSFRSYLELLGANARETQRRDGINILEGLPSYLEGSLVDILRAFSGSVREGDSALVLEEETARVVRALDTWVDQIAEWYREQSVTQQRSPGMVTPTVMNAEAWAQLLKRFELLKKIRESQLAAKDTKHDLSRRRSLELQESARTLGRDFTKNAQREMYESYGWSILGIVLVLTVSIYAILTLRSSLTEMSWQEVLVRAAAVFPLIGLATYASKIANHHRENERWSRQSSVRLETISAYLVGMDAADQRALRWLLGEQVFVRNQKVEPSRERPGISDDLRVAAEWIISLMSSSRGNGTEPVLPSDVSADSSDADDGPSSKGRRTTGDSRSSLNGMADGPTIPTSGD